MAIKIADLRSFAKNTKFTYNLIKEVYDHLVSGRGKENVDIDDLAYQIGMMADNNLNTFQDYIDFINRELKPEREQLTKEEIQANLHAEMNARVADNLRIKMGYSKSTWNKIKRYEEMMKKKISEIITNFMTEFSVNNLTAEHEESVELFLKFENQWKNFCRREIINRYPGSDKSTGDLRSNILNLFSEKVRKLVDLSKPSV